MKINTGDTLYEPISRNTGEVISVTEHPDGKIIKEWRGVKVPGHVEDVYQMLCSLD